MAIPFIMITLDKPRKLRLGMGAIREFEGISGKSINALNEDEVSVTLLSQLLWVMLKQDDPELTWEDSDRLVDDNVDGGLPTIITAINAAVNAAMSTGAISPNAKAPVKKH